MKKFKTMQALLIAITLATHILVGCSSEGSGSGNPNSSEENIPTEASSEEELLIEDKSETGESIYFKESDFTPIDGNMILDSTVKLSKSNFDKIKRNPREKKLKLPDCRPLIRNASRSKLDIGGVEFFLRNQKVVGVGKFTLDQPTLTAITERLVMLDNLQQHVCKVTNLEYQQDVVNYDLLKYLNDQLFATFNNLTKMASNIEKAATKPNSSPSIIDVVKTVPVKEIASIDNEVIKLEQNK